MNRDEYFMQLAYEQALLAKENNEVPVGAIIVKNDEVVSSAFNQVETLQDPTAHAEILAIKEAVKKQNYKHLLECSMYVTLEPCSMCAGSIVLSRLKRVVIGATDPKTGACGSVMDITNSEKLNHKVYITFGVLENSCSALLKDFFKSLRNKN